MRSGLIRPDDHLSSGFTETVIDIVLKQFFHIEQHFPVFSEASLDLKGIGLTVIECYGFGAGN